MSLRKLSRLYLRDEIESKIWYFDEITCCFIFHPEFENWCDHRNILIHIDRANVYWTGTKQDRVELLLTWSN